MMTMIMLMMMMTNLISQDTETMMRGVVCDGAGGIEVLQVASLPRPKADQEQVLLKVSHSAVNRADTLQRQGRYPLPPGSPQGLGLEAVGEVCQVGPGVDTWKVGDRAR